MDNILLEYAPLLLVLITILLKEKIFITPFQLEQTKSEILKMVDDKFVDKEAIEDLRQDIKELKEKLNSLYDYIITTR